MITAIVGALALLAGIGIGVFMSSLAFRHMMDAYSSTAAPAPIATDVEVGEDEQGLHIQAKITADREKAGSDLGERMCEAAGVNPPGTHDAAQRSAKMIGMTASEMWAAGIKTPEQAEADIRAQWAADRPRTVIGRDSENKPYAYSSGVHTTLADIADDMRTTMNDALPEVAANLEAVKHAQEATARGEELDPETQQLVEDWLTDEGHEHPMTPEQKAAYLRGMVGTGMAESGAEMIADEAVRHFGYAALTEGGAAGLMQAVTGTFDKVAEGGRNGQTLAEAGGAIRGAIGDGTRYDEQPVPPTDPDTGEKDLGVYITDAAGNKVRDYPEDDK